MRKDSEMNHQSGNFEKSPLVQLEWTVASEVADLAGSRLSIFRRNCTLALIAWLTLSYGSVVFLEKMGFETTVKGWVAVPSALLMVLPLVAVITVLILGERRIYQQACCDCDVYCTACKALPKPPGSKSEELLIDWVYAGHCPLCSGEVPRFLRESMEIWKREAEG